MTEIKIKELPPLVPVAKWELVVGDRSVASLRYQIFKDKEFVKQCVVKRGTRVLIDTAKYFNWLNKQLEVER